MGIADSTRRSGGAGGFSSGFQAGVAGKRQKMEQAEQSRENAITTYTAQKDQIKDNALKTFKAIQDRQAAFLIQHEKNVGQESGLTPTQFAAKNVEFETMKKLAEAQSGKMIDSLEQSSQIGVQMGYFEKGDISAFRQSISTIFQGLTSKEQAQVDALGAGAKEAAKAEAVGEMVNMIGPKGERVAVSVTDRDSISSLQKAGYQEQTPVSIGVQGKTLADIGLTKPVQTDLQKKLIAIKDELSRLDVIKARFKPEYQTFWTRASSKISGVKEKAGVTLDQEEKKSFAEFSKFKRESLENINLAIHRLTGAQMSKFEAKRIRKGLPDPGEGVFDGDAPTEFSARLESSVASLKAAERRLQFFLQNGIQGDIEELSKAYPLQNYQEEIKAEAPPMEGAKKAPDGNWYIIDPSRPGKYLQVQ